MTPEALQDALIADLTAALAGRAYPAEDGSSRPIRLFAQDLPPITGFDEQGREADSQQPYLIVRLEEGEIQDPDSPQEITVVLVITAPGIRSASVPTRTPLPICSTAS